MDYNAETARVERTIAGVKVSVIAPYAEGYVVNAGEAAMLNQTLAENFSNNLREKIGEHVPEGSPEGTEPRQATVEEAQAIVDAYMGEYVPGVRRAGAGGARTLDPVEKEMKVIAQGKLDELLKSKGLTRKKVDFAALTAKLISDNETALRASAEKIVAARNKQTAGDLDVSAISFEA
jgi:predicted membrane GTPase involved in stress response